MKVDVKEYQRDEFPEAFYQILFFRKGFNPWSFTRSFAELHGRLVYFKQTESEGGFAIRLTAVFLTLQERIIVASILGHSRGESPVQRIAVEDNTYTIDDLSDQLVETLAEYVND